MPELSPAVSTLAASYAAGGTPGRPQLPMTPAEQAFATSFGRPKSRPIRSAERTEVRKFLECFGDKHAAEYLKLGFSFEAACRTHRLAGLRRKPTSAERVAGGAIGQLSQSFTDAR